MKKICILQFILLTLVTGCSKDNIRIDPDNLLIGIWNYTEYQGNTSIYKRNDHFIDNHCYKFNSDGSMTERKNSGFCGTPPVSYADYPGTWSIINDTLIQISVGYWGGIARYKLDIEQVDKNSLSVAFVNEDNAWVFINETQCAHAWDTINASGTETRVKKYLEGNDISVFDIKIETYSSGPFCEACFCPSGRLIRVLIRESDLEPAIKLGFKK